MNLVIRPDPGGAEHSAPAGLTLGKGFVIRPMTGTQEIMVRSCWLIC